MRSIIIGDYNQVRKFQEGKLSAIRKCVKDINPRLGSRVFVVCNDVNTPFLATSVGEDNSISVRHLAKYATNEVLYVRECWAMAKAVHQWLDGELVIREETFLGYKYRSDGCYMFPNEDEYADDDPNKPARIVYEQMRDWESAATMPHEAARLFVIVKDVRFQRLQDMSEEDAIAEGWEDLGVDEDSPLTRQSEAWDKNLKRGERDFSWSNNPWTEVTTIRAMSPFDPEPHRGMDGRWTCTPF
jgi:hypothetical protein